MNEVPGRAAADGRLRMPPARNLGSLMVVGQLRVSRARRGEQHVAASGDRSI